MPLTITPTLQTAGNGLPRVSLALTTDVNTAHYVYRVDPDGSLTPVRSGDPVTPVALAATIYDYEAPFDVAVSYRLVRGDTLATVDSTSVTVASGGVPWLIHPGRPDTDSVPLVVELWPAWSRPAVRGLFQVIGRSKPIAVGMTRGGESGVLTCFTDGPTDYATMLDLLADGTSLLLNGTGEDGAGSRWVSIGDVSEEPTEAYLQGFVRWTLPVDAVAAPTGFAIAAVPYSAASTEWVSYSAMSAVVTDYADLSAGGWV